MQGFPASLAWIQQDMKNIPSIVEEALKTLNWARAIHEEIGPLEKNQIWKVIDLLEGKKIMGNKWVFTIKYKENGSIERYKVRLVAKGYTQTFGVDYKEAFSPVAKLYTIRVLLSITTKMDWPLHQFNVKNAFLYRNLAKEVFMDLLACMNNFGRNQKVCKLRKTLYGLKQSPRAWFGRFKEAMKRYGYNQSNFDHTMSIKMVK